MKKFLIGSIIIGMASIGMYLYLDPKEAPPCNTSARTFDLDYEASGSWSFAGSSQGPADKQSIATRLVGSWTIRCLDATEKQQKNEHAFALKDESGALNTWQILETIDNVSRVHRITAPSDIGKVEFHGIRDFLARVQFHDLSGAENWEIDEQDSAGTYRVSYQVLSGENGQKIVEKSGFESIQGLPGGKVSTVYAPDSKVQFAFSNGMLENVSGVIGMIQSMGAETLSESSIKFTVALSSGAGPVAAVKVPLDSSSINDDFQGTESFKRIERESNIKRLAGAGWKDLMTELNEITKESANETFLRLRAYFNLHPDRSAEALDVLAHGKADELAFRTLLDALLQIDDPRVEKVLVEALKTRESDPSEARYILQNLGLKAHAGEHILEGVAEQRGNPNPEISHIARLSLGNISQTVAQKYPEKTSAYLDEEIKRLAASGNPASIAENLHVVSNYGGQKSFDAIESYLNSKDEFLLETAITCLRFVPHDAAVAALMKLIKQARVPSRIRHLAIEEIGFHPLTNVELEFLGQYALREKSEAVVGSIISVLSKYYAQSALVRTTFDSIMVGSFSKDIKQQIKLISLK